MNTQYTHCECDVCDMFLKSWDQGNTNMEFLNISPILTNCKYGYTQNIAITENSPYICDQNRW